MRVLDPILDRAEEVAWVLDYLGDLEADFQVHYGIEDMFRVPAPRFLRLAERSVAYAGVMQARAQALIDAGEAEVTTPGSGSPERSRVVEGTQAAVEASPRLSELIEWGD